MTAQRFFSSLAALVAAAFVLGVVVYFPLSFWTGSRLFAAAMLPLSLALFAYTSRERSTDVNLALAGITGFLCVVHLLAAARIFAFAIEDESSLTAVLCIANLAFGGVIVLVSNAAAGIIAANIARNDTGGEYARVGRELTLWATGLEDSETQAALLALAEEMRYYPRRLRQDGGLPAEVGARAADVRRLLDARAWADARFALQALRLALEASRISFQSAYSKV